MEKIQLNKNNFLIQVSRYGYLAEQIPACFSSQRFSENIITLSSINKSKKRVPKELKSTSPVTLSTYKNDLTRRVLSLPNPEAFVYLVTVMSENWDRLKEVSQSNCSLSPITFITQYNDIDMECINSENLREYFRSKSDFVEGIRSCIRSALGYKFQLKVDITNFYNSIYTHSIAWAMCGKCEAKKYLVQKEPGDLKETYGLADLLDSSTRALKNNETNGIVVGPYTSRIFSEIILAHIDKQLCDKGFKFKRYVDDYKFYFRSESQAQESISSIEKILNEFNLNLNGAKTEITKFPFEVISPMKDTYDAAFKKDGVFGVLNAASIIHQSGKKGAYKYALKFIRDTKISLEEFELILPLLVNIMLINPKYGKYVIQYLKNNIKSIDTKRVSTIVNEELNSSLNNELQQETLLFLYFIRELGLSINGTNLLKVINSKDDFSILIALDLWKNRNKLVIRDKTVARDINEAIKILFEDIKGESYTGERWLLLYETEMHQLADKDFVFPEKDIFFKKMEELKISFYSSLKK